MEDYERGCASGQRRTNQRIERNADTAAAAAEQNSLNDAPAATGENGELCGTELAPTRRKRTAGPFRPFRTVSVCVRVFLCGAQSTVRVEMCLISGVVGISPWEIIRSFDAPTTAYILFRS